MRTKKILKKILDFSQNFCYTIYRKEKEKESNPKKLFQKNPKKVLTKIEKFDIINIEKEKEI